MSEDPPPHDPALRAGLLPLRSRAAVLEDD